jgi:hypothetical protein
MSKRQRRARRNRHFRIDEELKATDRTSYLAYLREPRTTNKSAHAWLVARGYTTFSESAVARHKRHALEGFEEQREAHRFALRLAEMSGGDLSSETFLRGAILRVDQLILMATFELPPDVEGSTAEDVGEFADAMERLSSCAGSSGNSKRRWEVARTRNRIRGR